MTKRTLITISSLVAATTVAAAGTAGAKSGDDHQQPITGAALTKASEAALAYTGQGRVTETEAGDEDSFYEVEVTLDDGHQLDVQLDRTFQVVDTIDDGHDDAGDD